MAVWYVRSAAAGAGTGANWTDAFTTILAAATAGGIGDTYYVAADHNESTTPTLTLVFKGTPAAPDTIMCVDHTGTVPPVPADYRTTAVIGTTGANTIQLHGHFSCYGLVFSAGSGASAANVIFGPSSQYYQYYQDCTFIVANTSTVSGVFFGASGSNGGCYVDLNNCKITFGAVSQGLYLRGGDFVWRNTLNAIQGVAPASLVKGINQPSTLTIRGVDLTALTTGKYLSVANTSSSSYISVINCRFADGVASLNSNVAPSSVHLDYINSDFNTNNGRNDSFRYAATCTAETVVVKAGGAYDGTRTVSRKIVSTANCRPLQNYASQPLVVWNDVIGKPRTLVIDVVNDGAILTNADIWVDLYYLGDSNSPKASMISTGVAVLANPIPLPYSTAAWATSGLTTPILQKIQVSFVPKKAGLVRAVVKIGKASTTLYYDPKLTLV